MGDYMDNQKYKKIGKYIIKLMATSVITLILLISLKVNDEFKIVFYKNVYEKSISFVKINEFYKKTFGSSIPLKDLFKDKVEPVFNETIKYMDSSLYLDGVKLKVGEDFLVPNLKTGMVIFIGEKEEYGKTVIVEQVDGTEVWYSNLEEVTVKLYDYIEPGNIIGNALGEYLYMVFEKDGKFLNYEDFL